MQRRVVELFAGVGGFRLGLERAGWEVVWSSQWEPGKKSQHASDCYVAHFGKDGHSNEDIANVPASHIPDHDLLVGGFPCQDYSVATTKAAGIQGKKGVLWWEIFRVLKEKRPSYALLENVDRLLKSPTEQRGRDFGVMLWCLNSLGYAVEWRVVNAADYSSPQKRRRVFVIAGRAETPFARALAAEEDRHLWLQHAGFFAKVFPVQRDGRRTLLPPAPTSRLPKSVQETSDRFGHLFQQSGVMVDGRIWDMRPTPVPEAPVTLGSVLERDVPAEFYVAEEDLDRWRYLKGAKAEARKADNGFEYAYTEGALPFPDPLDRPARTVMTDEGGLSPSRFKHIVLDPQTGKHRVLTPVEVERLNQFPDDWTNTGMPTRWRYFCMGNALVVGLVERIGTALTDWTSPPSVATPRVVRKARGRARA